MTDEGRYYMTYENVFDDYGSSPKLRQQNLIGSYDMFVPLGDTTRLFGGASAGLTKLENESKGYSRDTDIGYRSACRPVSRRSSATTLRWKPVTATCAATPVPRSPSVGRQAGLDRRAQQQAGLPGLNYHF